MNVEYDGIFSIEYSELKKDIEDAQKLGLLENYITFKEVTKGQFVTYGIIKIKIQEKCRNNNDIRKLVDYLNDKYEVDACFRVDAIRDNYVISYKFGHKTFHQDSYSWNYQSGKTP